MQAHVREFFGGGEVAGVVAAAPDGFADDLARGGAQLRAAFPALRRTLHAIRGTPLAPILDIVCEGDHDAAFYGFVSPTHRRVVFDEVHALQLAEDGGLVEDRLAIDIGGIVHQLHGQSATPSERR